MLRRVAAFEFRYQLRSPALWVGCILFFLLTFGSVTVDQIQIGARGNVNINSPFAILETLTTMSIFAVFIVMAVVANVVIRDDDTGFAPIIRTTSIGKYDYLVGRWLGATAAALLVLLMMPLAVAVGSLMPWLDAEKIGPFRLGDYLQALFLFGLPTLLLLSAYCFSIATATRSLSWSYVGAVLLVVGYIVMRALLRDPRFDTISSLADPFGRAAIAVATKYWTATERNAQLPAMTGLLLANRLLWAGVALVIFSATCVFFRFEVRGARVSSAAKHASGQESMVAVSASAMNVPTIRDDPAARRAQAWSLARVEMTAVFRSPAFFVLMAIGMLNSGASLWFAGQIYGGDVLPVTRLMVDTLGGAFTIIPIIIAIYYGGELVWRDRDRRVHEIIDATAAPDWAHLVPKIIAITLVLAATFVTASVAAMLVQAAKHYTQFEVLHYLTWFVLPGTIIAVQLAVLSVLVQVLVPHKFIGWLVMLLYLVASLALAAAGFEHNLYNYAGTSSVPLSDMNGTGHFWVGRAWFQAYWSAFAVALSVLTYALWRRGAGVELGPRVRLLPVRLRGGPTGLLTASLIVFCALGGWIFYNTNVLNRYQTAPDQEKFLA